MTGAPLRVLGRVRLSRDTEASTSIERQREDIERWADREDAIIVGWAEDLDLSGKIDPFETPDFGPWLRPPLMNDWDIVVAWRWDRVSRGGQRPKQKLIDWLQDNGKHLVTITDNVDTRNKGFVTDIVLSFTAGSAAAERQAIVDRQVSSQKKLREVGRFRGGPIPFGYRTVKRDGGWYLEEDPEKAELFREMVRLYLDEGFSLYSVAKAMNDRGIPSPQKMKRKTGPGMWRTGTIIQMFKSRTCLGETVYKGKVVRDGQGRPVMRAEPLITEDRFDRLQERLARGRKVPVGSFTGKKQMLLDILYCSLCGSKMYFAKSGPRRYWRCSANSHRVPGDTPCKGRTIRAEILEDLAMGFVRFVVGGRSQTEEVFFPAEGVGAELETAEKAIATIREEKYRGFFEGDEETYLELMANAVAERNRLKAMPSKPARYERVETGGTWGEAIAAAETPEDKRNILLKMGMRIEAMRTEDDTVKYNITTNLDELRATVPDALSSPDELELVHINPRDLPVTFTTTA